MKIVRTYGTSEIRVYSDEKTRNPFRDPHGRYTVIPPTLFERMFLALVNLVTEIGFIAFVAISLYAIGVGIIQAII